MSAIANFRVKHPRPEKLSDPTQDFTPEMVQEILAVPDNKMQALQFRLLFGPYLPAGTYAENIYFLPLAFRYAISDKRDVYDMLPPLIWFVSEYAVQLGKDGFLDKVRDCLRECFTYWTKEFALFQGIAKGQGWGASHYVYVKHSGEIDTMLYELVRFREHADLAEEFVQDLAYSETDPIKAAWYLHLARDRRIFVQRLPDEKAIPNLLSRTKRLRRAAELVRRRLPTQDASPLYWYQTFKTLNLD
jgi:hypothetical protein